MPRAVSIQDQSILPETAEPFVRAQLFSAHEQPLLRADHLAILSPDAASNHSPRLARLFAGESLRAYPSQSLQVRI
jgi:hypothetical protein